MQVDLTQIILWILEALTGFFMVRIYPQIEALIKSKIDTFKQKLEIEKLQKVLMEVDQFADAAEQMAKNNDLDGEWKNSAPYGAIHRIAVKYHGRGIVDFCFRECFLRFPNLKIDTHRDNIPMQKCLKRAGFEYCGIIYLANGDERLAYQKTK